MENRLLSIAEVAEFLNVSKRTVQRLIKRGSLRALAVGGQKRISRFALEEMLRGMNSPTFLVTPPPNPVSSRSPRGI